MKHCCTALLALALVCTEARADDSAAAVSETTDATPAPVATDDTSADAGTPAEPTTEAGTTSDAPTTPSEGTPPVDGAPVDGASADSAPAADTAAPENASPPADKASPAETTTTEAPPAAAEPVEEGFSLEKKVVPWVTVAVGAVSVVGAAALITAGGVPFYAAWDLDQKLVALESEDPTNIERAKLLQQSATLRRKEWNQYGAPLVTSGVVLLIAGGVFIAGGLITGMGLMDGAE